LDLETAARLFSMPDHPVIARATTPLLPLFTAGPRLSIARMAFLGEQVLVHR